MIADNYQCEETDITSNNLHITDFKNLRPGMKLKIPFISKPIIDTLEETESFISDYYPSLKTDFKEEVKVEPETPIPVKVTVEKEEQISTEKEEKHTETLEQNIIFDNPSTPVEQREVKVLSPYGFYSGNVIPNIPDRYIKKI